MKNVRMLVIGAAALVLVAGCAKPPQQELTGAQDAIKVLADNGVAKFAPDTAKKLNADLDAINQELKVQEDKWFKNYDKATQMIATLKTEADGFKPQLDQIKAQMKADATNALEGAKAAIAAAKELLANAPVGKGSKADIEAMTMDLTAVEESLPAVQTAIDSEDYTSATQQANTAKAKADEISAAVQAAMEKMGTAKK